jgi:mannose-6-phosphate isomerase
MPGPQLLLVIDGRITVADPEGVRYEVERGQAMWLSDDDPDVTVHAASARAVFYRTRVPIA